MTEDKIKAELEGFLRPYCGIVSMGDIANFAKHIADMAVAELQAELALLKAQIDGGIRVCAKSDGVFCDVQLWSEDSYEPNASLILDEGVDL